MPNETLIQQPATPIEAQSLSNAEKLKPKPKLPPEPPKPFLGFDALELPPTTAREQRAIDVAQDADKELRHIETSKNETIKKLKEIKADERAARKAKEAADNAADGAMQIAARTPEMKARGFTDDGWRRLIHLIGQTSLTAAQVASLILPYRLKP